MMKKTYALLVLGAIAVSSAIVASTGTASLDRPRIWNGSSYDNTMTDGFPIDPLNSSLASTGHASAKDSNNILYTVVTQTDGTDERAYLIRNTGTAQEAWDNDAEAWTTNFALADPIGSTLATDVEYANPAIAIDSNNDLYIAYLREDTATNDFRVFLNKFDTSAGKLYIWDDGASSLTTVLSNTYAATDSIGSDEGSAVASGTPAIAIDSNDDVYIAFNQQQDGGNNEKIWLSKFDVSATDVLVWDDSASSLTNAIGDATALSIDDSIGSGVDDADAVGSPSIAINGTDVYIAYIQQAAAGTNEKTYLSKFDIATTDCYIWDDANSSLTNAITDFADDAAIGPEEDDFDATGTPAIAIDGSGDVYVAWTQQVDAGSNERTWLSKFDDSATDVLIWDDSASSLTNDIDATPSFDEADGIGVGTGNADSSGSPAIVIDGNNDVYIAFTQQGTAAANERVWLSKFDLTATDLLIWDDAASSLTNAVNAQDQDDGISINVDDADAAGSPAIALAANNDVYLAFTNDHSAAGVDHIFTSYFDVSATDALIWDNGATSWTNVLSAIDAETDASDQGDAGFISNSPAMVASAKGIYVPYIQQISAGGVDHLYLTRIGQPATTTVGRRSSSGTCILGNTSDWAMIAFLASLGLLVGLGFRANVNEAK